jgi:putative ABC transport system substrate-binding protein
MVPPADAFVSALRKADVQGAVFTFGAEAMSGDLLRHLARSALPAVFSDNTVVAAGGLASLGEKMPGQGVRAVDLAVRILRGEKPATIPVDQLAKFHLAINLRTARAMGLGIPDSIRLQADQVIE